MQEMEIGFGKTAFSLDNQDGKLMVLFLSISFIVDYLINILQVDNYVDEPSDDSDSEYQIDSNLPNEALNIQPLPSNIASKKSKTKSKDNPKPELLESQITGNQEPDAPANELNQPIESNEPSEAEEEEGSVQTDADFFQKRTGYSLKPAMNVNNNLQVFSFEEDELVEVEDVVETKLETLSIADSSTAAPADPSEVCFSFI